MGKPGRRCDYDPLPLIIQPPKSPSDSKMNHREEKNQQTSNNNNNKKTKNNNNKHTRHFYFQDQNHKFNSTHYLTVSFFTVKSSYI